MKIINKKNQHFQPNVCIYPKYGFHRTSDFEIRQSINSTPPQNKFHDKSQQQLPKNSFHNILPQMTSTKKTFVMMNQQPAE